MAKPKGGLTKWFKKEKWVDISAPKKKVNINHVAESLQKILKEVIQNVFLRQRHER